MPQVGQLEAQVRGDQAQIDTARTQLSYTTITAPIDGRIGLRQVDSGNIARAGDLLPLTVITQLKPISVVFTLPQQALPVVANAMQEGMPEVLALKPGGSTSDPLDRGQLAVLDNQVDPATGTIKLKATFPNDKLLLWPGGFVNVRMLAETQRSVVTVPTAAVQRGPRGAFVFVINTGPVGPGPGAAAGGDGGARGRPAQRDRRGAAQRRAGGSRRCAAAYGWC